MGVVAILLAGLGLAMAQQPRPGENVLTVADPVGPPVLDPHKDGSYQSSGMVLTIMYEGLLARDDRGELQPNLAESWKALSPTLYEFKIRHGVTFHNGREMDASDVKYSFERELDPKTGSPFRAVWSVIETVETPDKWTVRFSLKYPSAPFLELPRGSITPTRSWPRKPWRRTATSTRWRWARDPSAGQWPGHAS